MTNRPSLPDRPGFVYANPILPGYYPDPSAIRVGEDYYLVTSSFEYFPGVPLFHSKDLFNWTQLGHILTRRSQIDLRTRRSSSGIYASTLRHHDGQFYMITTDVRGIGNFYVTAERPEGPWSDPIPLPHGNIDPSLFFDDDGRAYVTAQNGAGYESHIIQYEIDPATGEVLSEPAAIWRGDEGPWLEGPHLYKIRGRYYLMAASGGTSVDHREIIARGDNPYGPFEDKPEPFLTHRGLKDHPVQCLGHADLVEDARGDWWAVFLAMRPVEGGYSPLGRETFLAPVRWSEDGWPEIDNDEGRVTAGEKAVPVLSGERRETADPTAGEKSRLAESRGAAGSGDGQAAAAGRAAANAPKEEASGEEVELRGGFGPQWAFLRDYEEARYDWSERPGSLALRGSRHSLDDEAAAAFACLRQRHLRMELSAALDYEPVREGERAGIAARLNNRGHFFVGLALEGGRRVLLAELRDGERLERAVILPRPPEGLLHLKLRADETGYGCACSADGAEWTAADFFAPVSALSPEVNGGFTGVCVGLHASGAGEEASPAYYSRVRYAPRRQS
ncbi:glycoside hydrolase family 43 protein [Saccharibacillus sp. CPCC 101409]|uniref:glycoside hydrolase family 43 protein n=1 Tax=Saccharibacillus sp. CPCC 101409 TaxID=3058041 RepID=UPI0026728EA8|nr:glycoside hydrolase family 43 protein [Saccharibacillus sp. CPCC 101409]MDO3412323.1 glycoside hydrolase family 43 protein [Saccharibacillus sp. CPCC 101409]